MRLSGSGMPVRASNSMARARAALGSRPSCRVNTSPIWLPTVNSGFSAVIGSWKIMPIRAPRMPRICTSDSAIRSWPAKRMWPLEVAASTRRSTESAVMLLPDPDSPTSANFSPASMQKEMSSTTVDAPKRTLRRSTCSSGWLMVAERRVIRTCACRKRRARRRR